MNKNRNTVLLCHGDKKYLSQLQQHLEEKDFDIAVIDNAADLLPTSIRLHPSVIVVDPSMQGFNEHDICKHLMQNMRIQVVLVVEKNSTQRAGIGECQVEDVIDMNTDLNDLANLLLKHITVNQ